MLLFIYLSFLSYQYHSWLQQLIFCGASHCNETLEKVVIERLHLLSFSAGIFFCNVQLMQLCGKLLLQHVKLEIPRCKPSSLPQVWCINIIMKLMLRSKNVTSCYMMTKVTSSQFWKFSCNNFLFYSGQGDQNSHSLECNRCNWLYFLYYDIRWMCNDVAYSWTYTA